MKENRYYRDMQEVLKNLPGDFSILEEQIDIEDQKAYFDFSKKVRDEKNKEMFFKDREALFLPNTSLERKKEILSGLPAVAEVKAFRTLERYLKDPDPELRNWAVLALQESRMMLQSSLLGEKHVFISTGLGGKGQKLRYYVVFIYKERNANLTPTQQKLLKNELIFALKKAEGEFESIDFFEGFSSSLLLLPLESDLKAIFDAVIEECNQYGDFLEDDLIITNVKMLSRGEIIQMLNQRKDSEDDNRLEEI